MASFTTQMALFSALSFFIAFVQFSSGCSPIPGKKPDSLEERFYYSDNVVYGKITNQFRSPKPMYDSVYTAEMEVYCTFKGPELPTRINISDAGSVPGFCHSTNLTVGGLYTVFLDDLGNRLTPRYKEDNANDQYLEEISLLCEHDINYPQGLTELTAVMECPENYHDYHDCVKYVEVVNAGTGKNGSDDMSGTDLSVKPLNGNPEAEPKSNGEVQTGEVSGDTNDSYDGKNGSDVMAASCIFSLMCIIVSLFL